jgi:hypothetical protein
MLMRRSKTVLDPVVFLGSLGVVEAVKRPNKVSGNPSGALKSLS